MQQNMLIEETEWIGSVLCVMNEERVKQKRITAGQKEKKNLTYEGESGLKTSALKQVMMVSHYLAEVTAKCLTDIKISV